MIAKAIAETRIRIDKSNNSLDEYYRWTNPFVMDND